MVGLLLAASVALSVVQLPEATLADVESSDEVEPSPRGILRVAGIGDDRFDELVDGQPLDDTQRQTMLEIMFRLSRFNNLELDNWSRREFSPEIVKDGSKGLRGQMFRLRGWVTDVEPRRLSEKAADMFGFRQYYRCKFTLEEGQEVVVVALDVPKQWRKGGPVEGRMNQRATAQGLLLKISADERGNPVPLLLAQRVAWFPDTALGNLGMDVGLLDGVVHNQRITHEEREAFYQMLAAVGRAKPGQLYAEAEKILKESKKDRFSVVPLFNEPKEQVGKLVELSGTARRVVRARVDDPDIVSRFGIDHYYEIEIFTRDSQSNPIVFCVREIPEGMPEGEGKGYRQQVSIAGFYFKKYGYGIRVPTEDRPTAGKEAGEKKKTSSIGQLAPFIIGREVVWYPPEPPEENLVFGAIAGGLFVIAMLGIWVAVWRYNRADKRFHDETIAKNYALDTGVSLDEIDLKAEPEVDFKRLAELDISDAESPNGKDEEPPDKE